MRNVTSATRRGSWKVTCARHDSSAGRGRWAWYAEDGWGNRAVTPRAQPPTPATAAIRPQYRERVICILLVISVHPWAARVHHDLRAFLSQLTASSVTPIDPIRYTPLTAARTVTGWRDRVMRQRALTSASAPNIGGAHVSPGGNSRPARSRRGHHAAANTRHNKSQQQ